VTSSAGSAPCTRRYGYGTYQNAMEGSITNKNNVSFDKIKGCNSTFHLFPFYLLFVFVSHPRSLTCGFVGCGRYSNKHSVAHFEQTRHPYSLELATLRIWDYCHGEYGGFVQRADLLSCPSSPPLSYPWLARGGLDVDDDSWSDSNRSGRGRSAGHPAHPSGHSNVAEKSSKKAVMIGEEYETLLQSALEDQALHYEGEITSLRAELTSALVDRDKMTPDEAKEVEQLRTEIDALRQCINQVSNEVLAAQGQEAGLRATSQRLLSEQQKSNELVVEIQEEHRRETEQGRMQVEDLEQQIADLSANLRMRQQFSQSHELNNAQIFGTASSAAETKSSGGKRGGKKKGRFFRK
jgi:BRCA1-associated protein